MNVTVLLKNWLGRALCFVALGMTMMAWAEDVTEASLPFKVVKQELKQGGYLIGQTRPGAQISFLKHHVDVNKKGRFVIGFGRDFGAKTHFDIHYQGKQRRVALDIAPREWKIERIDGLPPSKVSPRKPEVLQRIRSEASLIRAARATRSELLAFEQEFVLPSKGRISGVYGSQRVLNGKPKRPHFGLDIAAPVGTPVYAPIDGVVSLSHDDMFYSGATLILDHGYGLSSTYIHLDKIEVEDGQQVKQGQLIARIGKSGRATGPHLDWRINWFEQRLDPALFVDVASGAK
ncbi:M23 family metallopeptidase [Pleionea sp. CnH1-48]|uniref:M23 family metallopeptidase n=1 Tax=Pleionea sp. CnH1-48 TaxID=2954494 RepID=UPI0020981868|nr:M23 family metallopeptidase [Pleionea sp. CnH1-48]MCO7226027.1 M23 family metallopeptidase [Pleionea sp. CnH1-48]